MLIQHAKRLGSPWLRSLHIALILQTASGPQLGYFISRMYVTRQLFVQWRGRPSLVLDHGLPFKVGAVCSPPQPGCGTLAPYNDHVLSYEIFLERYLQMSTLPGL